MANNMGSDKSIVTYHTNTPGETRGRGNIFQGLELLLKYLLLIGAGLYILLYLFLVFSRIHYPFALEWQEGLSLEQVRRILSGQKLYVNPSLKFVPYNYTPLYFYVSAFVAKIIGQGFVPLRLVSFISSLGCFLLIFLFVIRETQSCYAGVLAIGLFAATYQASGAWFDLARIDSLFLVLLLWAIYLLRFKTSSRAYILAGILITCSFLTKQTTLVIVCPIVLYCVVEHWRRSLILLAVIISGIVGSTLILDYIHSGWYIYYIFGLLQNRQAIITHMLVFFWSHDIIAPLAIACCMAIFYFFVQCSKSKTQGLFYLLVAAGMTGGAWIARFKAGGYMNNLMTAYAIIAILFGLAFPAIFEYLRTISVHRQHHMKIYVYGICIIQFLGVVYNPLKQIPTRQDLEAGKKFVDELAQIPGDIFLVRHGYLLEFIGKQSFAQEMAIHDILSGDTGEIKVRFSHEISEAIASKQFDAIIVDGVWWFSHEIEQYYEQQQPVFDTESVFWTVTGYRTRPEFIYVPKGEQS